MGGIEMPNGHFNACRSCASERKTVEIRNSRRNVGALPYAFTEQGVAMLSSVLRSERAVEVNIAIMRTFVQIGDENVHRVRALMDEVFGDKTLSARLY